MSSQKMQQRHEAAESALKDIVWLIDGTMQDRAIQHYRDPEEELEGEKLVDLVKRNFARLDPDNNGISRDEITTALMHPQQFDVDEYAMLKLLAKFFDTIINLSDDEPDEETVITRVDCEVLQQFLVHSKLKLSELHRWIKMMDGTATEQDIGPPPLSHDSV